MRRARPETFVGDFVTIFAGWDRYGWSPSNAFILGNPFVAWCCLSETVGAKSIVLELELNWTTGVTLWQRASTQ